MKKVIKNGLKKEIGIAKQVQGHVVDVIPHPKFKGLWQFKKFGVTWVASDYAFKNDNEIE